MKRNALKILLCMGACALMLCGCQKNDNAVDSAAEQTAVAEAEEKAAEQAVVAEAAEEAAEQAVAAEVEEEAADQTATEAEEDADWYIVATDVSKDEIENFADMARAAYLKGDWLAIAENIYYPITMYPDVQVNNESEFMEYMTGKEIAPSDFEEMQNESCHNMFANSQGVCMGTGQIWINEKPDGSLGITAVSGVGEP